MTFNSDYPTLAKLGQAYTPDPAGSPFVCPEFREQVADGVVYLRASCQRAICVRWRSGSCTMCRTDKGPQQDLLERRS